MIIAQTPFRVSFFGGGTDYPDYYQEHGGATLSATINQYCYLSVHQLSPFFKHRFRASYAQTELVQEPGEFKHPLIRECLLLLNMKDGLEISHVSDLPGQTGLGSSSSFTVGLLNALHTFQGRNVDPQQLAEEAIEVERVRIGDAGGHQDQYAASYGGLLRIDYKTDNEISVQTLDLKEERIAEFSEHLMMFYTGLDNSAQNILNEQTKNIANNSSVLQEMYSLVDRAQDILTQQKDICAFGELLNETWDRKKSLSEGISNAQIDALYSKSLDAGALGGKLLGAGGRGFLLIFTKPENRNAIRASLPDLQEVAFTFSKEGSRILFKNN